MATQLHTVHARIAPQHPDLHNAGAALFKRLASSAPLRAKIDSWQLSLYKHVLWCLYKRMSCCFTQACPVVPGVTQACLMELEQTCPMVFVQTHVLWYSTGMPSVVHQGSPACRRTCMAWMDLNLWSICADSPPMVERTRVAWSRRSFWMLASSS